MYECDSCFSRRTQSSLTLRGWASLRRKWGSWKTNWTTSPEGEKFVSVYHLNSPTYDMTKDSEAKYCTQKQTVCFFHSSDYGEMWPSTWNWKTLTQQQKPNTGWRRNRELKPERGRRTSSSGRRGWDSLPLFFTYSKKKHEYCVLIDYTLPLFVFIRLSECNNMWFSKQN